MSSFNKDIYDLKIKEQIFRMVLASLNNLKQCKNRLKLIFFIFILTKHKIKSFKIFFYINFITTL